MKLRTYIACLLAPVILVIVVIILFNYKNTGHNDAINSAELMGAKIESYPEENSTVVHFPWDWSGDNSSFEALRQLDGTVLIECRCRALSDSGVFYLADIKGLQTLYMDSAPITDQALLKLSATRIESIGLYETNITDAGLKYLSSSLNIKSLDLRKTDITDDGMEHLAKISTLTSLRIWETPISDVGIMKLKHLKSLKKLQLGSCTKVTAEGVRQLKIAMPWTEIEHENEQNRDGWCNSLYKKPA